MAEKFDFSLDQLADTDVLVSYQPNGSPFDLTGYTALLQMRKELSTAPAVTLSTTSSASGALYISSSEITMRFLKAAISLSLKGNYYYDLVATNGSNTCRVVEGRISINPATTRT